MLIIKSKQAEISMKLQIRLYIFIPGDAFENVYKMAAIAPGV